MDDFLFALTNVNLFFQNLGNWLLWPMLIVSYLGNEILFLIAIPLLYWVVDAGTGCRVGILLILSNGLNTILKFAFHQPRPFWVNDKVLAMVEEGSFGIPSGHSQNAAAIWGLTAYLFKKKWLTVSAIFLILLTGVSRLYLGVHYLTDVVLGWLVGLLLFLAFIRYERRVTAWFIALSPAGQYLTALVPAVVILVIPLLIKTANAGWLPDQTWSMNYDKAFHGLTLAPYALSGVVNASGVWVGMTFGLIYLWQHKRQHIVFGTLPTRVLQFLLGIAGLLLIWSGLDRVFPDGVDLIAMTFRWLRYAMMGFWVTAVAPLLFRILFKDQWKNRYNRNNDITSEHEREQA